MNLNVMERMEKEIAETLIYMYGLADDGFWCMLKFMYTYIDAGLKDMMKQLGCSRADAVEVYKIFFGFGLLLGKLNIFKKKGN